MMTKLVFRKCRDRSILALFPDIHEPGYTVQCYQHVGQHSSADYSYCIGQTKPATPNEYNDLYNELVMIGYSNLKVLQKAKVRF